MKTKILFFFIILILLAIGCVFGQNPQELRVGSFINGNLGAGQEIWYSVRAANTSVLIVETSGNTDTFLEVYDAQRNFIMENDDGPDNYNARVEIPAARGAVYLFKLRGFSSSSSGPFRILASMQPLAELHMGTAQSGNISNFESRWFSVLAAQNGILVVQTTGNTDTVLEAYNENLAYLETNDDGGENYNARIEINVRSGSTYYFLLRAFEEEGGPYRITASISDYPVPAQLNIGTFLEGNISMGESYWFSVRTAGRGRLVVETSGNTDTFLYAFNDSYELLDSDDDSGNNHNARIELNAEANRAYLFRLRGFSSGTSGHYRIFASIE